MFKRQESHNGLDVDARFLLANERTLLAWVRTGLTLIAGGVGVAFIATDTKFGAVAGLGAIVFGGLLSLTGYFRYLAADKAIRAGELPATGVSSLLLVVGVTIFSIILILIRDLGLF